MADIYARPAAPTFLGVELGNVANTYYIEGPSQNPAKLTFSLRREGQYLVLAGDPTDATISSSTVGSELNGISESKGNLNSVLEGKATGIMKGINASDGKKCYCTGYMLLRFTRNAAAAPSTGQQKPELLTKEARAELYRKQQQAASGEPEQAAPTEDFVLATAYNVVSSEVKKVKTYGVQVESGSGSQVHVEQILAYQLRHFLAQLQATRQFNLDQITIAGQVRFRFADSVKINKLCPACESTWVTLKKDYRCTEGIGLGTDR